MAVTSVGTPSPQRVTSGFTAAAGAWGASQNRAGGNLLVAVITGGNSGAASTFSVSENSGTWTQRFSYGNNASGTSQCGVAVFTKTASGGDAAPSFNTSIAGTGAVVVTLLEFSGSNTSAPIDTSGSFQSTGTAGTVTFSLTTTGSVASAGEYAVSAFTQERNSATNSWVETGTGWTSLFGDGASTSVSHTQINTQPNPASGSALSDAGHFSTSTSGWGAAVTFVITAAPPVPSLTVPPLAPPMIPPQLWDELLAVAEYRLGTVPPPAVPPFTYREAAVPGLAVPGRVTPGDPAFIPPGQADRPLLSAVAPPMIPPQLWDELLAVAAYRLQEVPIPSTELIAAVIAVTGAAAGAKTARVSLAAAAAVSGRAAYTRTSPGSPAGAAAVSGVAAAAVTRRDPFTGRAAAAGVMAGSKTTTGSLAGRAAASGIVAGVNVGVGGLACLSAVSGAVAGARIAEAAFTGAAASSAAVLGTPPVTGSFTGSAAASGAILAALPAPLFQPGSARFAWHAGVPLT